MIPLAPILFALAREHSLHTQVHLNLQASRATRKIPSSAYTTMVILTMSAGLWIVSPQVSFRTESGLVAGMGA